MSRSNMGKKKFSRQQLYFLRNEIPIEILIEKKLKMPCRTAGGRFGFLCPLCGEFNTSVNRQTNLARCFGCGKNFNAIDLVMVIRKVDFVTSIRYLEALVQNNQIKSNTQQTSINRVENQPTHIGNILKSIVPTQMAELPGASKSVHERIEALEKKVELLTCRMRTITEFIK